MREALRPYQIEGARYLARSKRALLADDPGLGKSAQAVVACDLVRARNILVICPAIARFNWEHEYEKFSTLGPSAWTLVTTSETALSSTTNGVICSYDLAIANSVSTKLCARFWDCVILDESHYLKDRKTQRTKLVYGKLGHTATYVWCLSGTPAKKDAGDLWPILSFFGLYAGDYWEFVFEFLDTEQTLYGLKIKGTKPGQVEPLKRLLARCMLRRERKEVMKDLPALAFYDVVVEAAPVNIRQWFSEVIISPHSEEPLKEQIAEEIRTTEKLIEMVGPHSDAAVDILAGLQKKTEKSRRYVGLQKAPSVAAIISQELTDDAYEKIVLFAWHRDVVECLREALKPWHPEVLYGGTTVMKRERTLKAFAKDARVRVLICNIVAAGIAIDLTAASEVGFVEPSYIPADNVQAVFRVHRFPQTKPVRVRYFGLYKHVDFEVQKILRRRSADLARLFDTPPGTPIVTPSDSPIVTPQGVPVVAPPGTPIPATPFINPFE